MPLAITALRARQILDSRGNPTLEVEACAGDLRARASVPSGASTGTHEAIELRDNEKAFLGKGVRRAVGYLNAAIATQLTGRDPCDQAAIDAAMIEQDGTENKRALGANALVGASMAVCRLAARTQNKQLYEWIATLFPGTNLALPTPFVNVINGGAHAGNELAIQEFMLVPRSSSFQESTQICAELYHTLKAILKQRYGKQAVNVGDEGGFAPPLRATTEALDALMAAIEQHGAQRDVSLALDCAASEFLRDGSYVVDSKRLTTGDLLDFYADLTKTYPIVSIEDPFAEDDFEGFAAITATLGKHIRIVGDDLLVTNLGRMRRAAEAAACNALLLKLNQIGTVTESLAAARFAKERGWNVIVSHRSGETNDDFIADLAVGLGGRNGIKLGAPCRGERIAKYNRLLEIEERLGAGA